MPQLTEEQSTLEGTVSSIIFQNEENGYTILRLDAGEEEMTVVGSMPGVSPGEYLTVRGQWVRHATYGTQFRADVVERRLPQGLKEIFHYLASGAIKGIGKATARQLIETFGEDALRVIEEEPEKLTTLKGISPKRARTISDAFRKQMGMRRLLEFLTEHQLPAELSGPLYRAYGDVALEVVRANPYVLSSWEFGVEFSQADALALSLGIAADDPQRLEAGLLFELSHNNWNNGHTFLPAQKLIAATGQLLEASGDLLEERLEALANRGELDRETIAGQDAVYIPALYEAETYIAHRIGEMSQAELLPPDGLDRIIARIQREQRITYAPQQRQAVEMAASRQVMLLTGGPGTGKTTCLRGVLALFEAMGLDTALAAPTGRAAKRLGELCSTDASTIHRLLETGFDPQHGTAGLHPRPVRPPEGGRGHCGRGLHGGRAPDGRPPLRPAGGLPAGAGGGPGPAALGGAGQPVLRPDPQRGGAHGPPHRDLPPGRPERHRPQRPHGERRGAARPAAERQRLLLPPPPGPPAGGGDHCGPVPPPAARAHGHPRRPDPGALPHPPPGDRHHGA